DTRSILPAFASPVDFLNLAAVPIVVAPDVVFGVKARAVEPSQLAVFVVVLVLPVRGDGLAGFERLGRLQAATSVAGKSGFSAISICFFNEIAAGIVKKLIGEIEITRAGKLDLVRNQTTRIVTPLDGCGV